MLLLTGVDRRYHLSLVGVDKHMLDNWQILMYDCFKMITLYFELQNQIQYMWLRKENMQ